MEGNVKNNYEIVSSDIYMVANTIGGQLNDIIFYNTPTPLPTTYGPTSYTFLSEDNRPLTYLGGWLDSLTLNQTQPTYFTFQSRNNSLSFGRNLLATAIGGGLIRHPWYGSDYTTTRSSETLESADYASSDSSGEAAGMDTFPPATFTNFEGWALRCVGPTPRFASKTITYDAYNQFEGFLVDPNYQLSVMNSQYYSGIAPIKNSHTDYVTTTRGRFETYIASQTGSSLTSFTSTYSGYTNLSGFTDTIGNGLSSDDVFDIEMSGANITLNTTIPMSDRMATGRGNFINEEVESWIATISSDALYTNCGPFTPTRTPLQYSTYTAPEDMCVRVKLTTSIYFFWIVVFYI